MGIYQDAIYTAIEMIISMNADLLEIIRLSVQVSSVALFFSCAIGLPLGAFLAIRNFRLRPVFMAVIQALMGIPPVVVGLIVYLHLSRSGPFGWMGLLYTPTAMIIAQTILITPIITALSSQVIEDAHEHYKELFTSLCIPSNKAVRAYIYDCRYSLLTIILAGFGRAISEVGAVIIVGGNIDHLTRVMTTTIALETSKGELGLALALRLILLVVAWLVLFLAQGFKYLSGAGAYDR